MLRSFARDWSEEGAKERSESYSPMLQELQLRLPVEASGQPAPRVIVPGAGLGRLANEIARLGRIVSTLCIAAEGAESNGLLRLSLLMTHRV